MLPKALGGRGETGGAMAASGLRERMVILVHKPCPYSKYNEHICSGIGSEPVPRDIENERRYAHHLVVEKRRKLTQECKKLA